MEHLELLSGGSMTRFAYLRTDARWLVMSASLFVAASCSGAATGPSSTSAAASTPTSPIENVNRQPTQRPPIEGLEFPMFSEGARPSTPTTGDAVLTFESWPGRGYPVDMAIYADGRVIWHPYQNDVGYFQLRLTPAGVDTIRSKITSTGLVDHDLNIRRPGPLSRLTILRGGRSVSVQWAKNASWLEGHKDNPEATPSQSRDLDQIQRLLDDPSAWQFSGDLYADPKIRPFVPFGFQFEYDRSYPDLSQLPSPASDLLARYDPRSSKCSYVTTEVARKIARALARAGFAPLSNTPVYLAWGGLPGESGGHHSGPHLNPLLPHELNCDRLKDQGGGAHFAGLPPVGTKPSKPLNDGRVIVQTNRPNLNIFADGRVIGPGDSIPAGANPLDMANSQQWLTRQGVQLLRSRTWRSRNRPACSSATWCWEGRHTTSRTVWTGTRSASAVA